MRGQEGREMEISLIQSTIHDIPDLVRVHTAAFKTDQFSNFMLDGREKNAHQIIMQKSLKIWLADPTSKLVKAVASDGTVVGWACWSAKGKDDTDTSEAIPQPKRLKAPHCERIFLGRPVSATEKMKHREHQLNSSVADAQ